MLRRYALFVLSLLFCTVFVAPQTFAHTFEQDGGVGVVLHVSPNDEPTVGQVSTIDFDVQDSAHTFQLSNCDCTLKVTLNDKAISTIAPVTAQIPFTFTQPGVYNLILTGKPTTAGAFQPFTVTFDDLKVNPATSTTSPSVSPFIKATLLAVIGISLMSLVVITALYKRKKT